MLSRLDTLAPAHTAQHRIALLFLCHLILFWYREAEREALMRFVQVHTDDVEVNNMIKSTAETLFEKGFEQGFAIGFEEGRIIGKTKVIQQDITKNIAKIVEQGIAIGIEQDIAKDIENVVQQAKVKIIQKGIAKDIENVIQQAKAIGIEQDIAKDTDKTIEQGIVIGIEQGIAKVIEQAKVEIYRAWQADWEKRRQAAAEKGLPFNDPPPPNSNNNDSQESIPSPKMDNPS